MYLCARHCRASASAPSTKGAPLPLPPDSQQPIPSTHFNRIGCNSSSPSNLSASSTLAFGSSLHNSSNLAIWACVTCLALLCSASDGSFTNHDKNDLSSMIADHWEVSHTMSLEDVSAAQG